MTTALIATPNKSSWTARRVEEIGSLALLTQDVADIVTGAHIEGNDDTKLALRGDTIAQLAGSNWRSLNPRQNGQAVKGGRPIRWMGVQVAGKDADDTVYGPRNSGDADFMLYLTVDRVTVHVRNNGKWVRVQTGDYQTVAAKLAAAATEGQPVTD